MDFAGDIANGKEKLQSISVHVSPFEKIRKVNEAGNEYWESRDLAGVLDYTQYRNFEGVVEKAKMACFNSGHRIDDHFADSQQNGRDRKLCEQRNQGYIAFPIRMLSHYSEC